MTAPPPTRASLLLRLRDPRDAEAWREFARLYAAVIYGYARRRGLQDADAADLMQDVLRSFATSVRRLEYDPRKGTFRAWLRTTTRNRVFDFLAAQARRVQGDAARLDDHPAPDDGDDWDRECDRKAFAWAADRVRGEFQPTTWDAFWATAVGGEPAGEVGKRLGLSTGAVYVAKSRVIARLRAEVARAAQD